MITMHLLQTGIPNPAKPAENSRLTCPKRRHCSSTYLVIDAVAIGIVAIHKQLPAAKVDSINSAHGKQRAQNKNHVTCVGEVNVGCSSCAIHGSPLLLAGAQGIQVRHAVNLLRHILCTCCKGGDGNRAGHCAAARAHAQQPPSCATGTSRRLCMPWLRANSHGTHLAAGGGRGCRGPLGPQGTAGAHSRYSWVRPSPPHARTCSHGANGGSPGSEPLVSPAQTANSCRPAPTVTLLAAGCRRRWAAPDIAAHPAR